MDPKDSCNCSRDGGGNCSCCCSCCSCCSGGLSREALAQPADSPHPCAVATSEIANGARISAEVEQEPAIMADARRTAALSSEQRTAAPLASETGNTGVVAETGSPVVTDVCQEIQSHELEAQSGQETPPLVPCVAVAPVPGQGRALESSDSLAKTNLAQSSIPARTVQQPTAAEAERYELPPALMQSSQERLSPSGSPELTSSVEEAICPPPSVRPQTLIPHTRLPAAAAKPTTSFSQLRQQGLYKTLSPPVTPSAFSHTPVPPLTPQSELLSSSRKATPSSSTGTYVSMAKVQIADPSYRPCCKEHGDAVAVDAKTRAKEYHDKFVSMGDEYALEMDAFLGYCDRGYFDQLRGQALMWALEDFEETAKRLSAAIVGEMPDLAGIITRRAERIIKKRLYHVATQTDPVIPQQERLIAGEDRYGAAVGALTRGSLNDLEEHLEQLTLQKAGDQLLKPELELIHKIAVDFLMTPDTAEESERQPPLSTSSILQPQVPIPPPASIMSAASQAETRSAPMEAPTQPFSSPPSSEEGAAPATAHKAPDSFSAGAYRVEGSTAVPPQAAVADRLSAAPPQRQQSATAALQRQQSTTIARLQSTTRTAMCTIAPDSRSARRAAVELLPREPDTQESCNNCNCCSRCTFRR